MFQGNETESGSRMDYAVYTVTAAFLRDTTLPRFKGSMLRGAMGHSLKSTVCAVRVKVCETCLLRSSCVYAQIFEVKPNPDKNSGQVNLPHPYVLDATEMNLLNYKSGESFRFSLILFGKMIELLPYFIYTFESMGEKGLGPRREEGRSLFELQAVHFEDQKIYDPENPLLPKTLPYQSLGLTPLSGDEAVKKLRIHLLTPLRMKNQGRLVSELDLLLLLRAVLRRLKALFSEFSSNSWNLDERELFKKIDQVQITSSQLHWEDQIRYSNRQKSKQRLGGMLGFIDLEGELAPYMPLLRAAEKVHIGKETSFGLGKISLETL